MSALLIVGGLIVFSYALWQRYDWGMHLMLQAVTWRDLHPYCWCYAGCISQMCDCEQLKQSNIHWCISTCLGCNFKWKKSVIVKLRVFVCVFRLALYCVFTTFPLLSLISMHGESWVRTPSFEKLTVCVLMSSTSVFQGLQPHFLLVFGIQKKNKGRQESSEGSGVSSLSLCDEGCWSL